MNVVLFLTIMNFSETEDSSDDSSDDESAISVTSNEKITRI